MSDKLRPAHEVLVDKLKNKAETIVNIQAIGKQSAAQGGVMSAGRLVPTGEIYKGELMEIGAFCVMCDVLQEMIVPEDKLDGIIEELQTIEYNHAVLHSTIENLRARKS